MIQQLILDRLIDIFKEKYNQKPDISLFRLLPTKRDFDSDFTIILFPFSKKYKINIKDIAGTFISELKKLDIIEESIFMNGYLNITLSSTFWHNFLKQIQDIEKQINKSEQKKTILIEYASPNTNKPLHLGHMRNVFLGAAISNLAKIKGHNVVRINLINDRGIHICKSMLAWKKWGNGITPQKSGKKGDHLVGDFYVMFEKELKKQVDELIKNGMSKTEAIQQAPLIKEAKQMLIDWENGDAEVIKIWKMMNDWVMQGFEQTFKDLDIIFDKVYYESDVYKLGKEIIEQKLKEGIVKQDEDKSIYIDLTDVGLDKKILIRSDGTSVYITQDIANAVIRYQEYAFDRHLYVVANEQIYHFNVLKEVLKRFGYNWYNKIEHYSYGMVELPEGKMKSREGKVVDADDLILQMYKTAEYKTAELGKLENIPEQEKKNTIKKIAIAAIKYFMLKVDPKRNMLFNPKESIDFEGNTSPFVQYTYTRILSLLRKAEEQNIDFYNYNYQNIPINRKEKLLLRSIQKVNSIIDEAFKELSPAVLVNYVYQLAKDYNSFYQETPILKADDIETKKFRLLLSEKTAQTIKLFFNILGMQLPTRM